MLNPVKEHEPLNRWGRMRRDYLKNHRKAMYSDLVLSENLWEHLETTQNEAEEMFDLLVTQMAEKQEVNEELKAKDQMRWIGLMNNIRNSAEEIVRTEIIYS
ncbi:TnpV protein [Butyrivibrio sp. INlla16]|uniref:TnpV protein n=1 Tax=Butyrivibrio sp. INlla16 TaxID=1520807 RepID=UPI001FA75B6C